MTRRHKWSILLAVLLAIILWAGFIPGNTVIPLSSGGQVRITKAPFWRQFFSEANATISYQLANGQVGALVVWQDPFDGPVTVFASTNQNVLFCLYDYDVALTLLRIDTSKPFAPPPTNSNLASILFTSSRQIGWATNGDEQEIVNQLREMDAGKLAFQSVSVGTRHYTPAVLLYKLQHERASLPP